MRPHWIVFVVAFASTAGAETPTFHWARDDVRPGPPTKEHVAQFIAAIGREPAAPALIETIETLFRENPKIDFLTCAIQTTADPTFVAELEEMHQKVLKKPFDTVDVVRRVGGFDNEYVLHEDAQCFRRNLEREQRLAERPIEFRGKVLEEGTDKPVPDAVVFLIGGSAKTTTDSNGAFALTTPLLQEDGKYQLAARAEGRGLSGAGGVLVRNEPPPETAISLPQAAPFESRVVNEAGAPVSGAYIEVLAGSPALTPIKSGGFLTRSYEGPVFYFRTRTGDDGKFSIKEMPAGAVVVTVFVRHRSYACNKWYEYRPSSVEQPIVVTRGCSVAGLVEDETGRPVPLAIVNEERSDGYEVVSDANGRFHANNLEVGRGTLHIAPRKHGAVRQEIDRSIDKPIENLLVGVPAPSWLVGKVVDEEGAPVAGARVGPIMRSRAAESDSWYLIRYTAAEDDGSFRLGPVEKGILYGFEIAHFDFKTQKATASLEDPEPAVVKLPKKTP